MVHTQTNHLFSIATSKVARLAVFAAVVAACSSGGGGDSTGPATPVLNAVSVTGPSQSVIAGATLQLAATPRDQNGNTIAATVTWSSSASGVATVSSSGLVTSITAGSVTITATATSGAKVVTGSLAITVTAPPVLTSVTVAAAQSSLVIGSTDQLTATPKDQFGNAIAATVTWGSSASTVASVSTGGLVTGAAAGTATITATATAGGVTVTGNTILTVTAPVVPVLTSVTISAPSSIVAVGSTLQFTASPVDQLGHPMVATLTWSSSATSKATINAGGLVTGVASGSTNISVSATANGVTVASTQTAVTVNASFATSASIDATTSLTFAPNSVDVAVGATVTWTFATTHNVTFDFHAGVPSNIPDTPNGSVARLFTQAGTFGYQCTLHPGMTGTVVVH